MSRNMITLFPVKNDKAVKRWLWVPLFEYRVSSRFIMMDYNVESNYICAIPRQTRLNAHVSKYKAIKTDIRVFTNIYRIENKYVKKITFVT